MEKKKPRDLIALKVSEVSLVDVPANKEKNFLLIKREVSIMKILKEYVGEIGEEIVKRLSNDLEGYLLTIDKYRENAPGELNKALTGIVKLYVDSISPEEDVEKKGAKLSKDTVGKLAKIVEQLKAIIGAEGEPEKKNDAQKNLTEDDIAKIVQKALEDEKTTEEQIVFKNKAEFEEVVKEATKSALGV